MIIMMGDGVNTKKTERKNAVDNQITMLNKNTVGGETMKVVSVSCTVDVHSAKNQDRLTVLIEPCTDGIS